MDSIGGGGVYVKAPGCRVFWVGFEIRRLTSGDGVTLRETWGHTQLEGNDIVFNGRYPILSI